MNLLKYAILGTGAIAAMLFIYSVYVFAVNPENFKTIAYGFLGFTIIFFVLVILRKLKEDRERKMKMKENSGDTSSGLKK
ncbi:MAG TPA: hypothetical protein VE870_16665 [Bacteroidales bacterium]|nr:hypothetical protein [Bacteroidales bacterium]